MTERWNLKRCTRADALVVGAICLFLTVLVPVLLAKPREQSIRRLCAANLSQIGKTMFVYANDYEGALPHSGGPSTIWGTVPNWMAINRHQAFGVDVSGNGGSATISSCFYLLVRYYEVPTRLFICRDDKGTSEFKLSDLDVAPVPSFRLSDAWDFGPMGEAYKHCSYSYHIPFGRYPLTTSRDPNMAVAADRNPFLNSPMAAPVDPAAFEPDFGSYRGTAATARMGNAVTHGRDGQNVLFLDGRVTFEKRSYCGLDNDNIYLISPDLQRGSPKGTVPVPPLAVPRNERDSVLAHDPNTWGHGATKKP